MGIFKRGKLFGIVPKTIVYAIGGIVAGLIVAFKHDEVIPQKVKDVLKLED